MISWYNKDCDVRFKIKYYNNFQRTGVNHFTGAQNISTKLRYWTSNRKPNLNLTGHCSAHIHDHHLINHIGPQYCTKAHIYSNNSKNTWDAPIFNKDVPFQICCTSCASTIQCLWQFPTLAQCAQRNLVWSVSKTQILKKDDSKMQMVSRKLCQVYSREETWGQKVTSEEKQRAFCMILAVRIFKEKILSVLEIWKPIL